MGRFNASNTSVPSLTTTAAITAGTTISATSGVQTAVVGVTASSDGTGTGLIPSGASIVSAASGNNDHIITLPAYVGGTQILISVSAICELRAPVISGQATSINGTAVDNGSVQQKELALAASTVYRCIAMGSFNWTVTAIAANGAVSAGGTPN